MQLSNDPICRFNRAIFGLVMVLAWAGLPQWRAARWQDSALAAAPVDMTAQQLESIFNAIQAAAQDLPRGSFDAKALVDEVGVKPENLFQWMRDNTSWLPYRGELKGTMGVLMDREGSSLDRALCLAALLGSAGKVARLAHADLNDDAAAGLLKKVHDRSKPPVEIEQKGVKLDDILPQYTQKFGLDPADIHHHIDACLTESARIMEGTIQRATDQSAVIEQQVGNPNAAAGSNDAALAAMKDHWWVQMQVDNGWQDLDVTAADATMGAAPAPATTTVAVDPKTGQFAIDPAERHQLTIRVIVEQFKGGTLTESPVLQRTILPADVMGQRIVISHRPVGAEIKRETSSVEKAKASLNASLLGQHEWMPVISVGSDALCKASVKETGEINQTPNLTAGQAIAGGVGDVLGAFGNGGLDAAAPGALTAEWIEYETTSPGAAARVQRREVFDLIGPDARAAGKLADPLKLTDGQKISRGCALAGVVEVLPQVCRFSPEYVGSLEAARMLANRKPYTELFNSSATMTRQKLVAAIPSLTALPGPLYDLAMGRVVMSPVKQDVYFDSINVLSLVRGVTVGAEGNFHLMNAFDIVANDVAVRPGAAAGEFSTRLRQGVVDTNAEALVLGGHGGNAGDALDKTGGNAAWTVIRTSDNPNLNKIPADIRARMLAELKAGNVVFASTAAPEQGWWRIDPHSGATLGIGPTGRGQAAVEYGLIIGFATFDVCAFIAMMDGDGLTAKDAIVCAGTGIGAGLSGGLGVAGFGAAATKGVIGALIVTGLVLGGTTGSWLNKSIPDK